MIPVGSNSGSQEPKHSLAPCSLFVPGSTAIGGIGGELPAPRTVLRDPKHASLKSLRSDLTLKAAHEATLQVPTFGMFCKNFSVA